MKRKRNERYKNADKTQRDAIYRYNPADKNTKMRDPRLEGTVYSSNKKSL
jgi:hypothetical protein